MPRAHRGKVRCGVEGEIQESDQKGRNTIQCLLLYTPGTKALRGMKRPSKLAGVNRPPRIKKKKLPAALVVVSNIFNYRREK